MLEMSTSVTGELLHDTTEKLCQTKMPPWRIVSNDLFTTPHN